LDDALEFLQSEWESLARRGAIISDEELYRHFVRKFGPPDDVAFSYAVASDADNAIAADEAVARHLAVAARPESRQRNTTRIIVAAALALSVLAAAVAGSSIWTDNAEFSGDLKFITHQGVTIHFSQGVESFADRVVSFHRGAPDRSLSKNAQAAIGAPDCQNGQTQDATFVALGHGGELTVEFTDNYLRDGKGPDLAIFEVGPQLEYVQVMVSADGESWHELGITKGRTTGLDLSSLNMPHGRFRYVRLIDAKGGKSYRSNWPGADIDAIGAIHSTPGTHDGE
jgi:hypothetical protein